MNIYAEIEERHQREAVEILERLLNNQSVSRWDALKRRHDMNRIILSTDKYDSIVDELNLIIDMAKESL